MHNIIHIINLRQKQCSLFDINSRLIRHLLHSLSCSSKCVQFVWLAISVLVFTMSNCQSIKKSIFFKHAERSRVVTVEAFPLFEILNALGNPTVDYFRCDICNICVKWDICNMCVKWDICNMCVKWDICHMCHFFRCATFSPDSGVNNVSR